MLTLVILRHAKSSWDDPAEDDFDRPLNARGRKAAPEAGEVLRKLKIAPDLVLCSPAKRTRETLNLALPEIGSGKKPEIAFDERLYLATAATLLETLRDAGGAAATVVLIGHNPGLHSLAIALAGTGEQEALADLSQKFPTAAVAVLTFGSEKWSKVTAGSGRLALFWTPKKS